MISYLAKEHFMRTAYAYHGKPYIWAGDDPSGFDCSGFVIECLKAAGVVAENFDRTAAGLFEEFASYEIQKARAGAIFFLKRNGLIAHTGICLDSRFVIHAAGGTRHTTDPARAWKDNAYVKIRPLPETNDLNFVYLWGFP